MAEINIDYPHFYLYDSSEEKREETKKRLTELKDMGMTEVGYGEFGVKGVMSGLYIERVWRYSEKDWVEYMEWAKSVINENKN